MRKPDSSGQQLGIWFIDKTGSGLSRDEGLVIQLRSMATKRVVSVEHRKGDGYIARVWQKTLGIEREIMCAQMADEGTTVTDMMMFGWLLPFLSSITPACVSWTYAIRRWLLK